MNLKKCMQKIAVRIPSVQGALNACYILKCDFASGGYRGIDRLWIDDPRATVNGAKIAMRCGLLRSIRSGNYTYVGLTDEGTKWIETNQGRN